MHNANTHEWDIAENDVKLSYCTKPTSKGEEHWEPLVEIMKHRDFALIDEAGSSIESQSRRVAHEQTIIRTKELANAGIGLWTTENLDWDHDQMVNE